MTEKKARRVVIIDQVKSDLIEQAIFVLRSPAAPEREEPSLIAQAQQIIDSYAARVYGARRTTARTKRHRRRAGRLRRFALPLLALTALLAAFAAGHWTRIGL